MLFEQKLECNEGANHAVIGGGVGRVFKVEERANSKALIWE